MTHPEPGEDPLRVAVIVGSTRVGRVGDSLAHWFLNQAQRRDHLDLKLLDLADYDFPAHYPAETTPSMQQFTTRLGLAEAFVVVTPEYNRSYPASLKQGIDYGYDEWQGKPVGFVSYGCTAAGLYAVEHLRSVFAELQAVTMGSGVCLNLLDEGLDERGWPREDSHAVRHAEKLLDQLTWWGLVLRDGRAARPYVS